MYYSFIMLKPDALQRDLVEPVMQYLKKTDVEIERLGWKRVDQALLDAHYAHVIQEFGEDFRNKLSVYFCGKHVIPMVVRSPHGDIIQRIRRTVGATDPGKAQEGTIRGDFGIDSFEKCGREGRSCENLIHASDSPEAAAETALWFGKQTAGLYFAGNG